MRSACRIPCPGGRWVAACRLPFSHTLEGELLMIPESMVNAKDALKAFGELLDAIPKGKRAPLMAQMCCVEITMKQSFGLLDAIRKFILDTPSLGGGDSPFVQRIDKLVLRPEP